MNVFTTEISATLQLLLEKQHKVPSRKQETLFSKYVIVESLATDTDPDKFKPITFFYDAHYR